jgi:HK97 family phage prohead protease
MEIKSLPFNITETKQDVINGQKVGIIKGHAAAFTKDRVEDIIEKGAFLGTLKEHTARGNRQIRMKFQHKRDEIIGGFPVSLAREDEKGLFVEGHINLEVQRGREVFSLAKQGVLEDMSIGFIIPQGGQEFIEVDGDRVRLIKQIDLREISIVDEPANADAQITEVKTVVPFQDLPLSDRDRGWDSTAALRRVREFTGSQDSPSRTYRNAFLWFDGENADSFGAYKLPIADVIDGRLRAVPRGIISASAALSGARGGVDIPQRDRSGVENNVNRYFRKINRESDEDLEIPFKSEIIDTEVKLDSLKDVEDHIRGLGFSRKESKTIISLVKNFQRDAENEEPKLPGSRDACLEKTLDEILFVQKISGLKSKIAR